MSRALVAVGAAGAFAAAAVLAAGGEARVSVWLAAGALLAGLVLWLERGPGSAKELVLVATLAGVAAAGRVLFAPIPGVQPVTVIVIAAGAALGLRAGIGVGLLAAFVSNVFLVQGPWTPFQMLGWGACGAAGAVLVPLVRRRIAFAVLACILGFGFSVYMDVWEWFAFYPHTAAALAVVVGKGLPFDVAHAAGNVVLALVAGPELWRLLERYSRRLHVEIAWA
jgi:energy-coupling factor transport system substrate-specific component